EVVLSQVRHFPRQGLRLPHIAKDNHSSNHPAFAVADGSGRILDGGFKSVAPDERTVCCQAYGLVLLNRELQWITGGFAGAFVDDLKNLVKPSADCLLTAPARHPFRHHVEIRDLPLDVSA